MSVCEDCKKMNLNLQNDCGEFWCYERGKYYPKGDLICSDFVAKDGSGGGCYITTIIVEILGFDDYCQCLEQLRAFRDQVMKNEPKYQDILKEYDEVGPRIAESLHNAPDKKEIAESIFETYIVPVCELLQRKQYEEAVGMYKQMVVWLKESLK